MTVAVGDPSDRAPLPAGDSDDRSNGDLALPAYRRRANLKLSTQLLAVRFGVGILALQGGEDVNQTRARGRFRRRPWR